MKVLSPFNFLHPAAVLAAASWLFRSNADAQNTCFWDSNRDEAGFDSATGTRGTNAFWSTDAGGTSARRHVTVTTTDTQIPPSPWLGSRQTESARESAPTFRSSRLGSNLLARRFSSEDWHHSRTILTSVAVDKNQFFLHVMKIDRNSGTAHTQKVPSDQPPHTSDFYAPAGMRRSAGCYKTGLLQGLLLAGLFFPLLLHAATCSAVAITPRYESFSGATAFLYPSAYFPARN